MKELAIMPTLKTLLDSFRTAAVTEREKGTYFEELKISSLRMSISRNQHDYTRRGEWER